MKSKFLLLLFVIFPLIIFLKGQLSEPAVQNRTMKLVPMMKMLLTEIQTVDRGIYYENYSTIKESGKAISDHPVMTEEDKKLVKSTLGEEIKQFIKFDKVVHHHADSMAMAAGQQNMDEVLRHYRIVQQGCVDCHTNYREKIMAAKNR